MRQTLEHLEPKCDVQEMSVTTARLTTKTAKQRARSRVQVTVEFHVVLRVVSPDLGFHVVIGVGRLNVQQDGFIRRLHFTTHTQHQVQSSFFVDVVVRLCPVIVNSICIKNSCIFHISKMSFEVLALHLLSITVDRRQLKKICNKIGWIH